MPGSRHVELAGNENQGTNLRARLRLAKPHRDKMPEAGEVPETREMGASDSGREPAEESKKECSPGVLGKPLPSQTAHKVGD